MKIRTTDTRHIEGNLGGRSQAMSINLAAMAHIMTILSGLYKDPIKAFIREYSTNARDAHIEARITRPIEVTLPTGLAPVFTVRDYGVGLSVDDLFDIYSQYGNSTKQDSNDFNGMLGMGSKSALAYCDQFVLTAVKDGVKAQVSIAKGPEGPVMTVVDTSATDDHNGVTVQIPVRAADVYTVTNKCEEFYQWWDEGTVLINGQPPKHFTVRKDALKVSDELYIIEGHTSFVVMGGVAYPTDQDCPIKHGLNGRSVVAFVEIGDVLFPPHREALLNDPDGVTKETLALIEAEFESQMQDFIQRVMDECDSHAEALRTKLKWERILPAAAKAKTYTYDGAAIPVKHYEKGMVVVARNATKLNHHSKDVDVDASVWESTLWVENWNGSGKMDRTPVTQTRADGTTYTVVPTPDFTAGQKKKLLQYLSDEEKHGIQRFVLLPGEAPDNPFIDQDNVVDWEAIKAIKLTYIRAQGSYGSTGRIPGSYDFYVGGDDLTTGEFEEREGVPGDEIDTSYPVFWVTGNIYDARTYCSALIEEYKDGFTVVALRSNRIEKFKRLFPMAKPVKDGVKAAYEAWAKTVTTLDRKALAMREESYYNADTFLAMRPVAHKIKDPAIREAIKLAQHDVKTLTKKRSTFTSVLGVDLPNEEQFENPLDKYPLYETSYYSRSNAPTDHELCYLNAAYKQFFAPKTAGLPPQIESD